MFKDYYWQTNAMQKMKEECGKTKEPGLVSKFHNCIQTIVPVCAWYRINLRLLAQSSTVKC